MKNKMKKGLPIIFGVLIMAMVVLLMATAVGPVEIASGEHNDIIEEEWKFRGHSGYGRPVETLGMIVATQTPTEAMEEARPYPGPTVGPAPTNTKAAYPGPVETEKPPAAQDTPVPSSIPPTRPAYFTRVAPSPFPSGTP